MKYEICKKLKDAGFIQGEEQRSGFTICDENTETDPRGIVPEGTEWAYVPPLEELLEACPDHCGLQREDFGWVLYVKGFIREETVSETPHEAVAKLWLSLNKNGKK